MKPLLSVRSLRVTNVCSTSSCRIVNDLSFSVNTEQTLAIVGESGSGKTTLCRALTRLFSPSSQMKVEGLVQFCSHDLLQCNEQILQQIRREQIRYIFQEPQQALNPVLTIRSQMMFASDEKTVSEEGLVEALHVVDLENAGEVLDSYPHQLSIGMAQRVAVAMAILPKPLLLIADEPTSAVDASLRFQLLDLLASLQQQNHMAIIIVTHDLEVARRYAHQVAVLQNGRIIELAETVRFFETPQHPYSRVLLEALPTIPRRQPLSHESTASEIV